MRGILSENDEDLLGRIEGQYGKGCIDYAGYFLSLYIAYNAWYYRVTNTTNDRRAVSLLKRRYAIWNDYCSGKTMRALLPYMQQLAELTQREPFVLATPVWDGELSDSFDWRSLIEYWYQVRCLLVHGAAVKAEYVGLAYHTLCIFMEEIIERMRVYLKKERDGVLVPPLEPQFHAIWHVDMQLCT